MSRHIQTDMPLFTLTMQDVDTATALYYVSVERFEVLLDRMSRSNSPGGAAAGSGVGDTAAAAAATVDKYRAALAMQAGGGQVLSRNEASVNTGDRAGCCSGQAGSCLACTCAPA